jgi:hypothetical protein
VTEARARGWDKLENGELLTAAEAAGFEVIVTTDRNLRHQQNLANRKLAIVVLGTSRWTLIKSPSRRWLPQWTPQHPAASPKSKCEKRPSQQEGILLVVVLSSTILVRWLDVAKVMEGLRSKRNLWVPGSLDWLAWLAAMVLSAWCVWTELETVQAYRRS